jgi:hypothetical protein
MAAAGRLVLAALDGGSLAQRRDPLRVGANALPAGCRGVAATGPTQILTTGTRQAGGGGLQAIDSSRGLSIVRR